MNGKILFIIFHTLHYQFRYSTLRKVMLMVVENLTNSGSEHQLEFENLLSIIHFYSLRAAMKTLTGLETGFYIDVLFNI